MNESDKIEFLSIVENLMTESNIEIRDTWKGWSSFNYDDFYTNGNSYGGTKLFDIIIKENGRSDIGANKVYTIPNFKSAGYDNFQVRIPKRLLALKHPIIHEIVHFLQHNTVELDENYVVFDETNYKEYVSQRAELEAHFIQILYIEKFELEKLNLKKEVEKEFIRKVRNCLENSKSRLELILYSKSIGII